MKQFITTVLPHRIFTYKELFEVNRIIKEIIAPTGRVDYCEFFRGQGSNNWDITPSIVRFDNYLDTILKKEQLLIDKFIEITSDYDFVLKYPTKNPLKQKWHILFQAQHLRLKTRLIDWTLDWEIALHFAIENEFHDNEDGQFWIFICPRKYIINYDNFSTIANTDPFQISSSYMINYPGYLTEGYNKYIGEKRRDKQHGRFFVQPSDKILSPVNLQDEFSSYLFKILIDKDSKQKIREELAEKNNNVLGINSKWVYDLNPPIEIELINKSILKHMTSHEIRQAFLDFFKSKQHKIVPSAPLVLKNDPTLMFTNSGMVQFKDYFLGNGTPPSVRIADTQKCLRVSGKHNDLEDVGFDGTHHTMFEMLGNWSFGDYFKKEAIEWSWEFLTGTLGLQKDRLYATVFGGDAKEGLESDEEARNFWRQYLPDNHILDGNKKDNFWEMGAQGPCGPCSEIHFDFRPDAERAKVPGEQLVNQDDPSVVEIWNNVFMQFERKADGSLVVLPAQHVDTGMGFERLCMVMQQKRFTYDTDVFTPFIQLIERESGKIYTGSYARTALTDVAMRVVADHIRAVAFTIADGQLPSSGGAGYVIRRILRRAVRYYYSFLDIKEPFLQKLIPLLATEFQDVFPELKAQQDFVQKVIMEEERSFLRTLEIGLSSIEVDYLHHFSNYFRLEKLLKSLNYQTVQQKINEEAVIIVRYPVQLIITNLAKVYEIDLKVENYVDYKLIDIHGLEKLTKNDWGINIDSDYEEFKYEKLKSFKPNFIDAQKVFELYDTYGFPIDLTQLIASENNLSIDTEGFERLLKEQKQRSKKDAEKSVGDWVTVLDEAGVEFIGYKCNSVFDAKVLKYRAVKDKKGLQYQIVLNKTPFYAESGGQVGDTGYMFFDDEKIEVVDTKKENDLIIHIVSDLPSKIEESVVATIDILKRQATSQNHSATHLMHAALHKILGNHATQKGQNVDDNRLRFDFQHYQAVSKEELASIEAMVNQKIRQNITLDEQVIAIEEARKLGAMMLFGEKYGENVRVITFDKDFSRELCGGTHVQATGEIGLFKIVAESAVAAGVRRIEAVTAEAADTFINEKLKVLSNIEETFKNPKDLDKKVDALMEENKAQRKQIEDIMAQQAVGLQKELRSQFVDYQGVNLLVKQIPISDANAVKTLIYNLEKEVGNAVIVFGTVSGDKPQLTIRISEDLAKSRNLNAGTMIRELAKEIKGGGGGAPVFATAGGSDTEGVAKALARVNEFLN